MRADLPRGAAWAARTAAPPAQVPFVRAALAAALVVAVDLASKVVAVALLDGGAVPLAGALHLTTVYNDTFARGMDLGAFTGPAACLLAMLVTLLAWRAAGPLARVDGAAPVALGLVAGAALGNAADFLRTGRGAVDFLGVHTAGGAIVFNLADVAAYAGTALLARTALLIAHAIRRDRRPAPVAVAERRVAVERPVEIPVAVPLFARADAAPAVGDVGVAADVALEVPPVLAPRGGVADYASPRRMADTTRSANRSTSSRVV